jgi:hypothetical protein
MRNRAAPSVKEMSVPYSVAPFAQAMRLIVAVADAVCVGRTF